MQNNFFKGENILVEWSVIDKTGTPILFTSLDDAIVVITDRSNKTQTFSKLGGQITEGANPNEIKFEITEAMTNAFKEGKLKARFTYKVSNGSFASGQLVDIIEEGVNSEFITLQR